jgi:Na+/H+-dicarboxylate symporter/ABC-type amino acid transport substrate-binding protein
VTTATRRFTLSTRILIGLTVGIVLGLFVGERASVLQVLADGYVKLLQMTVLPYVTVSIIAGLGSLSIIQAKALGTRVGAVLVLLWLVALLALLLFPLMFPRLETASFYSTTLVEEREPFDLVSLYIPANPFNSLANNIVPAVVLFSIVAGVALIAVPNKATLLDVLGVVNLAVSKATGFVVSLTPYGIFAIAAVAAGTLRLEDVQRLQVYLVSYIAVSLLLSLWVLPGLVAALTTIPYRAVLAGTRDALVTAFMTGSLFVVLPMLTEQTKRLLREYVRPEPKDEALPDVIVPASFNFPHTGKLLSLSFVLFAGWYADATLSAGEYPQLAGTGLLVLFGNVNAAIPFLLDLFRIPADTFQLFLATAVVNARFGTLMSAVHTVAVALLGTCAIIGVLRIDRWKLFRFALITVLLAAATVSGTRVLVTLVLNRPHEKDKVLAGMQMLRDRRAAHVYQKAADVPALPPVTTSVADRITERGVLRVGYLADSLPYAFFNASNELVGFDIEMAHQLASDLGVALELVPADRSVFEQGLPASSYDLLMSGAAVTADRAVHVLFSVPYLDETVAFVALDHRRAQFSSWDSIRAGGPLRVGVLRAPYYDAKIRAELPGADIIPIDRLEDAFGRREPPLDAFMVTAERGSAYTLLHPEYSVAVPMPRPLKVPLAYAIADRDQTLASVVNTWIDLKRKDGTIDALFAHWILGRNAVQHTRRWSILDNVLRRAK